MHLLIGADLATEQHVDEVGPTRARATRPLPELLLRLAAVMRARSGADGAVPGAEGGVGSRLGSVTVVAMQPSSGARRQEDVSARR